MDVLLHCLLTTACLSKRSQTGVTGVGGQTVTRRAGIRLTGAWHLRKSVSRSDERELQSSYRNRQATHGNDAGEERRINQRCSAPRRPTWAAYSRRRLEKPPEWPVPSSCQPEARLTGGTEPRKQKLRRNRVERSQSHEAVSGEAC